MRFKIGHAATRICLFALMGFGHPSLAPATGAPSGVSFQPAKPVPGSAVLFQVRTPAGVSSLSGKWLGHQITFARSSNENGFYGFAGIPVETAAGVYELHLTGTRRGANFELVKKVRIALAHYPKVAVTVAKQFTEPSQEQLKQIAADKGLKQSTFAKTVSDQLWEGNFKAPVAAPVSGVFGTERVFNGEVQSRHLGLDFAVSTGTPVHAINSGTVVLAQNLYFEGGFVVIDHGQGLMSLYLHLSDYKVKEGDSVAKGQLIGLSGGSGRATGPHLHLALRWQGVYLNPADVLSLRIPK